MSRVPVRNALHVARRRRDDGGQVVDQQPEDLKPLYNAIAPAPNTEYGSILPIARDTQTGEKRMAMPSMLRDTIKGGLDLVAGTKTGVLTPEALQAFTMASPTAGYALAPRGALAAGASRLPAATIEREVSPNGFYSHAAEVAGGLPQAKGTPGQMKAMLMKQGVKPDEFKWSGYDESFGSQPSVTREQLAKHFSENAPKVEETTLGTPMTDTQKSAVNFYDSLTREDIAKLTPSQRAQYEELKILDAQRPAKFATHQLPGGENYREVLLHMPNPMREAWRDEAVKTRLKYGMNSPEYEAVLAKSSGADDFMSSHWDQPNVLAHLRMSDRTGPQGEKILHLEELQSDWAQQGRKQGFQSPEQAAAAKQALTDFDAYGKVLGEKYKLNPAQNLAMYGRMKNMDPAEVEKYEQLQHAAVAAGAFEKKQIPAAPFVDSTSKWVDLGLKRALTEAARGGYDKMVLTPGAEQAARYDLSKHVDKVNLVPDPSGKFRIDAFKDNKKVIEHYAKDESEVASVVGKEVADKLFKTRNQHGASTVAGQDLRVGGEGMKNFYDKIVPGQLEKLAKRFDPNAKVGKDSINTGPMSYAEIEKAHGMEPGGWSDLDYHEQAHLQRLHKDTYRDVHSIDITPQMRERILKGLPAYKRGGRIEPAPRRAILLARKGVHDRNGRTFRNV